MSYEGSNKLYLFKYKGSTGMFFLHTVASVPEGKFIAIFDFNVSSTFSEKLVIADNSGIVHIFYKSIGVSDTGRVFPLPLLPLYNFETGADLI